MAQLSGYQQRRGRRGRGTEQATRVSGQGPHRRTRTRGGPSSCSHSRCRRAVRSRSLIISCLALHSPPATA
ncbi:hypothetical protein DMC30DRAFT_447914 [Rhodotorula diobovata]|uniref:Uncharacterized protein n=1 Tax=Rhodotorula diobovata TaxID=5288 RepID=A0A5C5FRE1_9BASI|nr:hypothetical protein DMC30DRAFT_447914 [Rhodotorula diobovata]